MPFVKDLGKNNIIFAIDYGSKNTSVGFYYDKSVRIIENTNEDLTTLSQIYYDPAAERVIVGKRDQAMASFLTPDNDIYVTKRFIACGFDNPNLATFIPLLSYDLDEMRNDPVVKVPLCDGSFKWLTPHYIARIIFYKVKKDIEAKQKSAKQIHAVLSVPSCFNVLQRDAIKCAAEEAGLKVLDLVNSTTAVASYYISQNYSFIPKGNYFLVYELGGSTFNLAIFRRLYATKTQTIGMSGDRFLGGIDFDNVILTHVCKVLAKNCRIQALPNKTLLQQLRPRCEKAKIDLSNSFETEIYLKDILPRATNIKINRHQFEILADDLLKKTIGIVDCLLKDVNLTKDEIAEIVLSGGSTRIPKIAELLDAYFGKKIMGHFIDSTVIGVKGTAIEATFCSNHPKQKLSRLKIDEVAAASIGVSTMANLMKFIIRRNSLQRFGNYVFYTEEDGMETFYFDIFEGERIDCRLNKYITTVELTGLIPTHAGQSRICVELSLIGGGFPKVFAKQYYRNKEINLSRNYFTKLLKSEAYLANTLTDELDNKENDENFARFENKKTFLINYGCQVRKVVKGEDKEDVYVISEPFINTLEEIRTVQESVMQKLDVLWQFAKSTYGEVLQFQESTDLTEKPIDPKEELMDLTEEAIDLTEK